MAVVKKSAVDVDPLTADGTYYRVWGGGRGIFRANGTFGAGTLTLSVLSSDGTNYNAVGTDTTFTADDAGQFFLDGGSRIAAILTGSTGASIYYTLAEVR